MCTHMQGLRSLTPSAKPRTALAVLQYTFVAADKQYFVGDDCAATAPQTPAPKLAVLCYALYSSSEGAIPE